MSAHDPLARLFKQVPRGQVRAYSEKALERKLRKELPLLEVPLPDIRGAASLAREMMLDQLGDLCAGVGLSERQRQIALLRAQGWTVREIAAHLGVRRQSVERHYRCLKELLGSTLAEAESHLVPGRVPYYGWQEVYLDSLKPRG